MANKDYIMNEKDFVLPEGWTEVTRPPIEGGAQVPPVAVDRFASGAVSTMTLGLNTDIASSQMGGNVPSFRIQPPQPSAIAAVNAAVQSVITSSNFIQTVAAAVPIPDPDVPVINENVQTGTSYTVVLNDRNTLISMTNNSGGIVTLPGQSTAFGYVTTAFGINSVSAGTNVPLGLIVNITNTLGNALIVVAECDEGIVLPVSDTNGNTYTFIAAVNGVNMYYATNIKGGPNAIRSDANPTTFGEINLAIHEFSGVLPGGLDSFGTGIGSASITVHFPNTVAVGLFRNDFSTINNQSMMPAVGWTGMPPAASLPWQGLYVGTLDEYLLNPPLGTLVVTGQSPNMGSFGGVGANFKTSSITSAIMPAGWYCYIENTGTGSFTVQSIALIDGLNQTIILAPNTGVLVVSDGVGYWTMRGGATGGITPYLISDFLAGTYTASQDLMAIPVIRPVSFAADFLGSQATLQTAATATTIFTINKIVGGVSTGIGLITFSASGTVGVFTSTGHAVQSLASGNVIQVVAPASPDSTAASLGFTLAGTS